MPKKRDDQKSTSESSTSQALSRRDFLKKGAAAGVGAAVFAGLGTTTVGAQGASAAEGVQWDYEVDVLVVGGGAMGLPRPRSALVTSAPRSWSSSRTSTSAA